MHVSYIPDDAVSVVLFGLWAGVFLFGVVGLYMMRKGIVQRGWDADRTWERGRALARIAGFLLIPAVTLLLSLACSPTRPARTTPTTTPWRISDTRLGGEL